MINKINNLRKMAHEAIKDYGDATAGGGEPEYPAWAKDLLDVLDRQSRGEPVAFSYDLATTRSGDGEYTHWSPRLSYSMPNVPDGSIRNLQWLYAAPAVKESLTVADPVKVPNEDDYARGYMTGQRDAQEAHAEWRAAQPSVPEYTAEIGLAGQAYLNTFKGAHPLPTQFRWAGLWMDMCKAAAPTPPADGRAQQDDMPVRQYYYQVSGCTADRTTDPSCICWHDEGTGPLVKIPHYIKSWRNKPAQQDADRVDAQPAFYINPKIIDPTTGKIDRHVQDALTWSSEPVANAWNMPVYIDPITAQPDPVMADRVAWQANGTGVERTAVMVDGRSWYRDDDPKVADTVGPAMTGDEISDEEIKTLSYTFNKVEGYPSHFHAVFDCVGFARALLARYGNAAQPTQLGYTLSDVHDAYSRGKAAAQPAASVEPVARFNWGKGKIEWLVPYQPSFDLKPLYFSAPVATQPVVIGVDWSTKPDETVYWDGVNPPSIQPAASAEPMRQSTNEQAVLQSPEAQRLREDAGRWRVCRIKGLLGYTGDGSSLYEGDADAAIDAANLQENQSC